MNTSEAETPASAALAFGETYREPPSTNRLEVPVVTMQTTEHPRTARPFGLTKAVPVLPVSDETLHSLTLCPERQVSVTPDNEAFVHTPSMTTSTTSQTQYRTETDHQKWMDSDTAPTIDQ